VTLEERYKAALDAYLGESPEVVRLLEELLAEDLPKDLQAKVERLLRRATGRAPADRAPIEGAATEAPSTGEPSPLIVPSGLASPAQPLPRPSLLSPRAYQVLGAVLLVVGVGAALFFHDRTRYVNTRERAYEELQALGAEVGLTPAQLREVIDRHHGDCYRRNVTPSPGADDLSSTLDYSGYMQCMRERVKTY
jgi:hypothetical protein